MMRGARWLWWPLAKSNKAWPGRMRALQQTPKSCPSDDWQNERGWGIRTKLLITNIFLVKSGNFLGFKILFKKWSYVYIYLNWCMCLWHTDKFVSNTKLQFGPLSRLRQIWLFKNWRRPLLVSQEHSQQQYNKSRALCLTKIISKA